MATYNQSDILYSSSTTTYNQVAATIFRTATGSGAGDGSASGVRVVVRTATSSGAGASTSDGSRIPVRTATGSGVGGSSSVEIIVVLRTATGSGTGTGSGVGLHIVFKTATSSGNGTSTTVGVHVAPRTGTSAGQGTQTATRRLVAIRTATATGTGTALVVGARLVVRTGTATGAGDSASLWVKSHILRLPANEEYPGGLFGYEGTDHRLRSYDRSGRRAPNLYKLTDGTFTTVEQRDQGQVEKVYLGSHQIFLTDPEVSELTAAGYGNYIT